MGRNEKIKNMIYLLYGSDFKKSRLKLHALQASFLEKSPRSSSFHFDSENFEEKFLDEIISGKSLFSGRCIVVLDKLLGAGNFNEFLFKKMKELSLSENIFIFLEEKMGKKELGLLKKWTEKTQEFSMAEKEEKFKIFSLSDALGRRDKKGLWVLYQKALGRGISVGEIRGILFWQVKNLLMLKKTKEPKKLGQNPYVLRKNLSFLSNFKEEELADLSRKLVELPHRSRRGEGEEEILLENFLLSL